MAKDTVKAAEAAAKSRVALEALESQQITLTEAAVLTEFEQDGSEAIDRLVPPLAHRSSTTWWPSCAPSGQAHRPAPKPSRTTPNGDSPSSMTRTGGAGSLTGCRCATCSATETTVSPRL